MDIKTVLFAVDNSEHSQKAIGLVEILARASKNLHVIILNVFGPLPSLIAGEQRHRLEQEMQEEGMKRLVPYKEQIDKLGVASTVMVLYGEPGTKILEIQETQNCDVIVMGARGLSSFDEILLGSVSQKVLSCSNVPVFISK